MVIDPYAVAARRGAAASAAAILETVPATMRLIRGEMRRHGEDGLSVVQLRTLLYLRRRPGIGISELAHHLGVGLPTASALVARLGNKGLVVSAVDPRERRRVRVHVSRHGGQVVDHVQEQTRAWLTSWLRDASTEELAAIQGGLAVLQRLVAAETSSPAGQPPR
jgi:DNA-binding MarR family transcriptional regulator